MNEIEPGIPEIPAGETRFFEEVTPKASLCGRAKRALGALVTAAIVADKGVLLRNLSNIKPF